MKYKMQQGVKYIKAYITLNDDVQYFILFFLKVEKSVMVEKYFSDPGAFMEIWSPNAKCLCHEADLTIPLSI